MRMLINYPLGLLEHPFSIQDGGEKNLLFRRDVAMQRLYSQRKLIVLPKKIGFLRLLNRCSRACFETPKAFRLKPEATGTKPAFAGSKS